MQFDPPGPTLAEELAAEGLRCAAFVATAVLEPGTGLGRGFERWEGGARRGPEERPAGAVVRDARRWLAEVPAGAPFFLFTHFYDPHDPYRPPAPWDDAYPHRPYAGEVAAVDRAIGGMLRSFADDGRLDDAMVVLISDHGEAFGEHDEHGHGFFVYDATLRVPLVIAGAAGFEGGVPRGDPARTIDVMPTVRRAFGLRARVDLPGRALQSPGPGPDDDAFETYAETFHAALSYGASDLRTMRVGRWKWVRSPRDELYDVAEDPRERRDLSAERPDRAADLEARLDELLGADLREPVGLADAPPLDEETAERLRALGYVADGRWSAGGDWRDRPDPKDFLGIPQLLDGAQAAAEDGRWGEVLARAEEVLGKDPRNPKALALRARERLARGDGARAFAEWEAAVTEHPDEPEIWRFYGRDLLEAGRADDAVRALERSVALDGGPLESRVLLARAALAADRPDVARRELEVLRLRDPEFPGVRALASRIAALDAGTGR